MSTTMNNIDIEWENFISSNNDDILSDDEESETDNLFKNDSNFVSADVSMDIKSTAPKATNIYKH